MRHTLSKAQPSRNGILSTETTAAILEQYMKLHGPSSEERLAAVLTSGEEAATSLMYFQMVMRGDLVPELQPEGVVFRNADSDRDAPEPSSKVVRQVSAEVVA
jgi:hypothetical protein